MTGPYVPLHVHSHYSLCTGTASPEALVGAAQGLGLAALAMTDSANLYGAVRFYQFARERGIKPILGAQLPVGQGHAVLLARDYPGYQNLCRLVTQVQLGHGAGAVAEEVSPLDSVRGFERSGSQARNPLPLALEQVASHQTGLFVLCDCPEMLQSALSLLPRESLAAEIVRPNRDINQERRLLELAAQSRIPVTGTTAAVLLRPDDLRLHWVLVAIRENRLVTALQDTEIALPEHSLCSPDEFRRRFEDLPQAVENTVRIADQCDLDLPLGKPIFPGFALPKGETAIQRLRAQAEDGLRSRYRPVTPQAKERLDYELGIIERLGFAEYFLVVADIVRFAKSKGIPNVGRGSGASSIVSFVLGITNVDPIRFNIHFERFLNLSRSDCPDIDLDFCWQRRDEVIDYVFRTYGAAHTAMISTHATFRERGAFREVAKACGVSNDDIGRLADHIDMDESVPIDRAVKAAPDDLDLSADQLASIIRDARRIVGFPRHLSVHCGGIIISPGAIDTYVPLQRAAKGVIITQFEMNAVEDIGLVKIDLLGNRALSTIGETLRLVGETRNVHFAAEGLPETDEPTFEMLRNGLTIGVNQLESPAMRNLLRMVVPKSVEDVIAALALVRPGAAGAGMKEEYVRRARHLSPVTYPHACVVEILADSLGIMLYEDDAMLVANRMAGLTLEEGDRFRKVLKKRTEPKERQDLKDWFVRRCARRGVPRQSVLQMWEQMDKFQSYSFCKSHACGYGQVAYQCAWLKRHFPAEFMVAVLNHHGGMYSDAVHVEEARRMGVKVLLPCVNRSEQAFGAENGAIRIGLGRIRGLGGAATDSLLAERAKRGAFASLNDFLARVSIGQEEAESLVLCGAFDFTGRIRPELVWELRMTFETEKRRQSADRLFQGNFHALRPPKLNDFDPYERLTHEIQLLGMSAAEHILAALRPRLPQAGISDSRGIRDRLGKPIRLYGMLDARRTVETGSGRSMEFITLEDEYGLWECTLFARAHCHFGSQIGPWGPYLVEGTVEEQYGAHTIRVNRLKLVSEEAVRVAEPGESADSQDRPY
jgi:DNA-directed DNA polymerase III PolC